MKTKNKLIYMAGGCFVVVLSCLAACSGDNSDDPVSKSVSIAHETASKQGDNLGSLVKVTRTTNLTTETFFKLGVRGIIVQQTTAGLEYTFDAFRDFEINGTSYSYGVKHFILRDGALFDSNDPSTVLTVRNNEIYIRNGSIDKRLRDIENFSRNTTISTLVLLTTELVADNIVKDTHANHTTLLGSPAGGCDLAHTRYVYGIGLTDSAALANLQSSMDAPGSTAHMSDCRQLNNAPEMKTVEIADTSFPISLAVNTFCCSSIHW